MLHSCAAVTNADRERLQERVHNEPCGFHDSWRAVRRAQQAFQASPEVLRQARTLCRWERVLLNKLSDSRILIIRAEEQQDSSRQEIHHILPVLILFERGMTQNRRIQNRCRDRSAAQYF